MPDEVLSLLLELSQGDRALEFFLSSGTGKKIDRRDGKVFLRESFKEDVLTVRYLSTEGKSGLATTLSLTKGSVQTAVKQAKALSRFGKEAVYPELWISYPEMAEGLGYQLSFEEMLAKLDEAITSEVLRGIARIEKEVLSYAEEEIILIREGRSLFYRSPSFSYFVSVISESPKAATGYAYNITRSLADLNLPKLFSEATWVARVLSKTKKGSPTSCAVLFPPVFGVHLLEILSYSFLGDEVVKGRSRLKGRLGQRVFSETITIVDDGLASGLTETRPFDDEGMPQQRTILVDGGVVRDFLLDSLSAKLLGLTSNGKARRPTPGQNPKPSPTNLYLVGGVKTKMELLKSYKCVFEVLEVLGAHTADPVSGEFSLGVSGILYREGEEMDYLCEMALTGNLFDVFAGKVHLGSDLTFYENLGMPSILIPNLTLG